MQSKLLFLSIFIISSWGRPLESQLNTGFKVANPEAAPVTLNTIFYTPNNAVPRNSIDYHMFVMCDSQPTSGWMQIRINPPQNTKMNTSSQPWPAVEVGTSAQQFTVSTVLATNYLWGSNVLACDIIEFPYNENTFVNRTVYVRVAGEVSSADYGLQVLLSSTGSNGCPNSKYDSRAFPTSIVSKPFDYFKQYATSGDVPYTAANFQRTYFYLQFCKSDLVVGSYSVGIDVTYSPAKPRSSFNMYACKAAVYTQDQCTEYVYSTKDDETAPFAGVLLSNSAQEPLTAGIWVLIIGLGGETDNQNAFYLSAKIASQ